MSLSNLSGGIIDSGRLSEHAMIELLGLLFAYRRTGVLVLKSGRIEIKLFAFNGIPVFATSTSPGNAMIEVMAKDKMLTQEDVAQVKQLAVEKGIPIEECIMAVHEVTKSQLYYYQVEAAKEIIVKACGFKEGSYNFLESDNVFMELEMYDLNPLEIIYEGMTRYHISNLAQEIYAVEARRIKLNPGIKDYFLLPGPFYEHSDILDVFIRDMPVSRAIIMLQDEFKDINQAIYLLYMLLVTGLLVFIEEVPREEIFEDAPAKEPPRPEEILEEADLLEVEEVDMADEEEYAERADRDECAHEFENFAPGSVVNTETKAAATPRSQAREDAAVNMPPSTEYASAKGMKESIGLPRARKKSAKAPETPRVVPGPEALSAATVSAPPKATGASLREVIRPAEGVKARPRVSVSREPEKIQPRVATTRILSTDYSDMNRREIAMLKKQMEDAKTYYDVLEVTVEDGVAELQEAFTKRKKIVDPEGMGGLPPKTKQEAVELLARLEEAYQSLADPSRRIEYERTQFEDEIKRAWNMGFKKSLAKKMDTRGNWYMRHNSPQFARECYKNAVDLDPEFGEYYMNLGWAIFRAQPQSAAEAKSYLNSAVNIDHKLDMAYYYLGVISKREENNQEAESFFRMALDANANNVSASRELAFLTQRQKQKGIWNKIFGG